MKLNTKFNIGDIVSPITDRSEIGIVTAIMFRVNNISYEVGYGTKICWHLELELTTSKISNEPIGFQQTTQPTK